MIQRIFNNEKKPVFVRSLCCLVMTAVVLLCFQCSEVFALANKIDVELKNETGKPLKLQLVNWNDFSEISSSIVPGNTAKTLTMWLDAYWFTGLQPISGKLTFWIKMTGLYIRLSTK